MKRTSLFVAGLLLAGFSLVPVAAADDHQVGATIDASGPIQDTTTTCVIDTDPFTVTGSVETPVIEEEIFVERQEETVPGQEFFVPGVTVGVGNDTKEVGGFWVETDDETVAAGPFNETVGPLQVSEEVDETVPGVFLCIEHPE